MAATLHPQAMYESLREAYLSYYDTAFRLRDEGTQGERRKLFSEKGVLFTEPLLEPVPDYLSYHTVGQVASRIGLDDGQAELLSQTVFGGTSEFPLRLHQEQSLEASFRSTAGRNVIVTAGTGSGKTESFLLPVFARLIREASGWQPFTHAQREPWWADESHRTPWGSARSGERRGAAVRAIVLYPTNALVQDQVSRLRRAISAASHAALMRGNCIYVGQYTGSTLGSGPPPTGASGADRRRRANVAPDLRSMARDISALREAIRQSPQIDESLQWEFPDPHSSELLTRWDMQESPPDILITNTVMLNVMLMRDLEDRMFEATARWLREDKENALTLIVDELHSYRGTAGSEVAMIIRKLRRRLGLSHDSPQLRCIGTSASLEATPDEVAEFGAKFFGLPQGTFSVLEGSPRPPRGAAPLSRDKYVALGESLAGDTTGEAVSRLLRDSKEDGVPSAVESSCLDSETRNTRATSIRTISDRLFDAPFPDELSRVRAMDAVLTAVARQSPGPSASRFRSHMFIRNVRGVWACSKPDCTEVAPEWSSQGRTVGKLYSVPRLTCDCGSRVLELLYCETCGEPFLGGFTPGLDDNAQGYLFPSDTETPSGQPILVNRRTYDRFVWYWPRKIDPGAIDPWNHRVPESLLDRPGQVTGQFRFALAAFDHRTGYITPVTKGATGTMMTVSGFNATHRARIPALPERCPQCNREDVNRDMLVFYSSIVRSPIRGSRSGFARVSQVLVDRLLRELKGAGASAKTLVFTDSRDDAARTSAGIALNHHRNTVRQAVYQIAQESRPAPQLMRASAQGEGLPPRQANIVESIKQSHPDVWAAYRMLARLPDDEDSLEEVEKFESSYSASGEVVPWQELTTQVERVLLEQGLNPAGPRAKLQSFLEGQSRRQWWELYDFPGSSAAQDIPPGTVPEHREPLRTQLRMDIADSLFDRAARDFESLGLGWVVPAAAADLTLLSPLDKQAATELVASSLRILGLLHRYKDQRFPSDNLPVVLRQYVDAVAERYGCDPRGLREPLRKVLTGAKAIDEQFKMQLERLAIQRQTDSPCMTWVCSACTRRHMHGSAGICTASNCHHVGLEVQPETAGENGYFEALTTREVAALRTAELTGQTRPLEEQRRRQRRFKGAFVPGEFALAQDIELLSVTTTMEVGVDIGLLQSVVMANVPPQRFNYQQRVGRSGRREQPVSYALTLARDRSHDDDYFQDTKRITGDPPPRPYLDMESVAVLKRSVASEVLRVAFRDLGDLTPRPDYSNTHGNFGDTVAWESRRDVFVAWLSANRDEIQDIVQSLTAMTGYSDIGGLVRWACDELPSAIDAAVAGRLYSHDSLSELLANAGILPMFGFPTRQRPLYRSSPGSNDGLDESILAYRPLDQAVSAFAPGSELVRDGITYSCVGFARWTPGPGRPVSREPLGSALTVSRCPHCQSVRPAGDDGTAPSTCSACGQGADVLSMYQPLGFRTDYSSGEDFDDELEQGLHSSSPQIGTSQDKGVPTLVGRVEARTFEQEDVFVINDNSGRQFNLRRLPDSSVVVTDPELYRVKPRLLEDAGTPLAPASIGSVSKTDVLTLELKLEGLEDDLSPTGVLSLDQRHTPAGRAALTSFGHHLRVVAAHELDIDPQELSMGIQPVAAEGTGTFTGRVFLADALENGAGYASQIGKADFFTRLLERLMEHGHSRFASGSHRLACDTSCPDCLRSYENRYVHALLDWRLALDVSEVAAGHPPDLSRWFDRADNLVAPVVETLGFDGIALKEFGGVKGIVAPSLKKVALLGHPLWSVNPDFFNSRQADAYLAATEELRRSGGEVVPGSVRMWDLWTLARNPHLVIEWFNP